MSHKTTESKLHTQTRVTSQSWNIVKVRIWTFREKKKSVYDGIPSQKDIHDPINTLTTSIPSTMGNPMPIIDNKINGNQSLISSKNDLAPMQPQYMTLSIDSYSV